MTLSYIVKTSFNIELINSIPMYIQKKWRPMPLRIIPKAFRELRIFSWFYVRGSFLVNLGFQMWCWFSNLGQLHVNQVFHPLNYLSGPCTVSLSIIDIDGKLDEQVFINRWTDHTEFGFRTIKMGQKIIYKEYGDEQ